jgi:hypothetical protein
MAPQASWIPAFAGKTRDIYISTWAVILNLIAEYFYFRGISLFYEVSMWSIEGRSVLLPVKENSHADARI